LLDLEIVVGMNFEKTNGMSTMLGEQVAKLYLR